MFATQHVIFHDNKPNFYNSSLSYLPVSNWPVFKALAGIFTGNSRSLMYVTNSTQNFYRNDRFLVTGIKRFNWSYNGTGKFVSMFKTQHGIMHKFYQIFIAHFHRYYRFLTQCYFKILPVFWLKTGKSKSWFGTQYEILYDMYYYFYLIEF